MASLFLEETTCSWVMKLILAVSDLGQRSGWGEIRRKESCQRLEKNEDYWSFSEELNTRRIIYAAEKKILTY